MVSVVWTMLSKVSEPNKTRQDKTTLHLTHTHTYKHKRKDKHKHTELSRAKASTQAVADYRVSSVRSQVSFRWFASTSLVCHGSLVCPGSLVRWFV